MGAGEWFAFVRPAGGDDLRRDHDYLGAGGVFTEDIIGAYIEAKMEHDMRALDRRLHPHEYILYFDM